MLAVSCSASGVAVGGDLNPPAGPIAPTQRTPLGANTTPGDADSTFRIGAGGSYFLTGDVVGEVGKAGIEIAADNVSLDLSGFTLSGVAGSLDGISVPAAQFNLSIHDGVIRGWGEDGLDARLCRNSRVERLRASHNAVNGLYIGQQHNVTPPSPTTGGNSLVDCTAEGNGIDGLVTGANVIVRGCVASANIGVGIRANAGCTVADCTASKNSVGIAAGAGTTVRHCTTLFNTPGMFSGAGISLGENSVAIGNTSASNAYGILATGQNTVVANNSCYNNRNSGSGVGISMSGAGGRIEGNALSINDIGIQAEVRTQILNNTVMSSGPGSSDGIQVRRECFVMNNNCWSGAPSGGAGIHVLDADNRIEANNVTAYLRGIDVDVAGNLIIRNSASGNTTNYDIVAGNTVGPTVTSATIAGSSNPHANYDF